MMILANIFERLNDYSGLFALLAFLAAAIVPIRVYRKQKRDERRAMKDELDAMDDVSRFSMTAEDREYYAKRGKLEKSLKRK